MLPDDFGAWGEQSQLRRIAMILAFVVTLVGFLDLASADESARAEERLRWSYPYGNGRVTLLPDPGSLAVVLEPAETDELDRLRGLVSHESDVLRPEPGRIALRPLLLLYEPLRCRAAVHLVEINIESRFQGR